MPSTSAQKNRTFILRTVLFSIFTAQLNLVKI